MKQQHIALVPNACDVCALALQHITCSSRHTTKCHSEAVQDQQWTTSTVSISYADDQLCSGVEKVADTSLQSHRASLQLV
jgi:hypothetical protein